MNSTSISSRYVNWSLFLIMLFLAGLYYVQLRFWYAYDVGSAPQEALATGKAMLPFQYRCLVPHIARTLHLALHLSWNNAYKLTELASFVALILLYRRFLAHFITAPSVKYLSLSLIYPLIFTYVLPPWARRQPYDLPAVMAITAGLLCIIEQRLWLYYLIFVIGTINRETTCFLTLFFISIRCDQFPPKKLAMHVIFQSAVWFIIKAFLFYAYRDAPRYGGVSSAFFLLPILSNLKELVSPMGLLQILSMYGYSWIPIAMLQHKIRNINLFRMLIVVPVFLLAMLIVGIIHEMRIFGEMIPVVWTVALAVLFPGIQSVPNNEMERTRNPLRGFRSAHF